MWQLQLAQLVRVGAQPFTFQGQADDQATGDAGVDSRGVFCETLLRHAVGAISLSDTVLFCFVLFCLSFQGETPQTVIVYAHEGLVDSCVPGDRVMITGKFKHLPVSSIPSPSIRHVSSHLISSSQECSVHWPIELTQDNAVSGRCTNHTSMPYTSRR